MRQRVSLNVKIAVGAALLGAVGLGATIAAFSNAQPDRSAAEGPRGDVFSEAEEAEIRAIVRAYLLENPEVLIDSLNAYSERQRADAEARAEEAAKANLAALLNERHGYAAGAAPEKAKVAVIELFDYHCSFCKRAAGMVRELTRNDPAVKVVFRDLPILREESEYAARVALAARAQGKFEDLHFAFMAASGVLTRERVDAIAREAGVDMTALETALKDPALDQALAETDRIARDMLVDGTPTFIVAALDGSYVEVIPGLREDALREAIKKAKKGG
ncbi:DsbA family protein [Amphiplicatus metriothermophilus]|uniref:Protein-disulfide isomerase n=1 Tax=Amphiplicatus metriothermophilus TaxID=1519374 RepID=A0A239Q096_9PROT|nr:DsbA family protein [Amphiplicatus metriothermophilus]MBB5520163.1 protein-disulfide isomerase [Amphiplicatus metriothermophilus]SNT75925.1 Protein-disulfide isomerase [Amphiplicatus metriothermophilus]